MSDNLNAAIALASKLTQSAEEFSPTEAPAMCDVLAKGLLDAVELLKDKGREDAQEAKVEALALVLYVKESPGCDAMACWRSAQGFYHAKPDAERDSVKKQEVCAGQGCADMPTQEGADA